MNLNINKIRSTISYRFRRQIDKKIVIIESDDWGLERAKNQESLHQIIDKYSAKNTTRWTTDALESPEDLDLLYSLFANFRDKFVNPPILTANFITHNIDLSSEEELIFKPISEGYTMDDKTIFSKYKEGMDKGYFRPQLHGFSHYNTALLAKDFDSTAFQEDFKRGFPLAKSTLKEHLGLYRAECFDPNFEENFKKAMAVFEQTFGYTSQTFIPPNYQYDFKKDAFLSQNGIQLLQSGCQLQNSTGNNVVAPYFRPKKGMIYSLRNARLDTHKDYNYLHKDCIDRIEFYFSRNVPAIIDIHRVNFSGQFAPENRLKTIEELEKVLNYLQINHPEVIFVSSDQFSNVLNR